jgi:sugar lactone lactonase YvrE
VVGGGEVTAVVDTPERHAIACAVGGTGGNTLYMLTSTTLGGREDSRTGLGAAVETVRV